MRLSEYECLACRHQFEELTTDHETVACPVCMSQAVPVIASPKHAKHSSWEVDNTNDRLR